MYNELDELRARVKALEQQMGVYLGHSHGQFELGLETAQIKTVYTSGTTNYQGFAIKVTANAYIAQGKIVCWLQGASGADYKVNPVPTSGNSIDMPIGVATANIAQNATGWIIVAGYAYVLPMRAVTPTRGYVVFCSATEAGNADQAASGATAQHWREVGHWCANGAGAGALTLATLHFN
jgi:hypothetical protein